jgi:hypothetical protein
MVVCCDILLTMFMHEHFWCLVLCDKVAVEKKNSNKTCVSYTMQNVQWAFTFVLFLVRIGKVPLTRAL